MKIVFSPEDCRTLIYVVEIALKDAGIISKEKCMRVLDDDDLEDYEKLAQADKNVAARLEKAFSNLEVDDEALGDALT